MELGLIVPVRHLRDFAVFSNYHLVLAHMVEESEDYRRFYYNRSLEGAYITLDNSSYELGDDVYTPKQLIEFAEAVGASEVMAPETLGNARSTIDKVEHFCAQMTVANPKTKLKVFATIHGETLMDVHRCYDGVIEAGADTLGFSCRLNYPIPGYMESNFIPELDSWNRGLVRLYTMFTFLPYIRKYIESDHKPLRYHLLGLNHPAELSYYHSIGLGGVISSCDTSAPFLNGFKGRLLDRHPYLKPENKMDFHYDKALSSTQYTTILRNIEILKEFANDT